MFHYIFDYSSSLNAIYSYAKSPKIMPKYLELEYAGIKIKNTFKAQKPVN